MKDDAKEVATGFECGIQIEKYNDIKEGDIIEITFATRKLKAKIVNIAEHVRKEEAKEMYIIIEGEEDKE